MQAAYLWRSRLLIVSGLLILAALLLGSWSAEPGYTRLRTLGPPMSPTPGCIPDWSRVGSPSPGSFQNGLLGVVALAPNDVWAVGSESGPDWMLQNTLILHWGGTAWSVVPSAGISNTYNTLAGIDGVATNDLWAVGSANDGVENLPLTMHWDGTAWTPIPSANPNLWNKHFYAVSAVAANDVWAVGSHGGFSQPVVERWDGSQWNAMPAPVLTNAAELRGVSAVAANDIWAVGVIWGSSLETLTAHWDGNGWQVVPSPNPSLFSRLEAVAARASNDVWAVGLQANDPLDPFGSTRSLILHWDGSTWTAPALPTRGDVEVLNGVTALAPDDVWAVGTSTLGCCTYRPLALHWDGTAWSLVPITSSGSGTGLNGVAGVAANDVWAVGGFSGDNRSQTLIEHYSGACATPTPTPTACPVQFSDVPPSQPFYPYVRCLACRGIISGYGDGTFRPGADVTRGQLAKYIANAADYSDPIYIPGTPVFEDVARTDPFRIYIERSYRHEVIGGYDCGAPGEPCPGRYFRPTNFVTRGQTAKFVANAAYYADVIPPSRQTFADVPSTHPFWLYIERAAAHGIISGYDCGGAQRAPREPCDPQNRPYFRPANNVTRAQAAKFTANAFYPNCQTPARWGP